MEYNTDNAPTTAKTRKTRGGDSTQERIVNAAEQLFAERTYEGTTLRHIAAMVGIKEPSLYAHFTSKSDIYDAVIERALTPISTAVQGWHSQTLSEEQISAIPRRLMEMHLKYPNAAKIIHKEMCQNHDRVHIQIRRWINELIAFAETLIAAGSNTQVNRSRVIVKTFAFANVTLGFFSNRDIEKALMGDAYDEQAALESQIIAVTAVFECLIGLRASSNVNAPEVSHQ